MRNEMLEDIRRVHNDLGAPGTLTGREYNEYSEFSDSSIRRVFGSWNKAVESAGLKPTRIRKFKKEDIKKDILRVYQSSELECMSLAYYEERGVYTKGVILSSFKSWNEVLIELDIPVNDRSHITDQEYFDDARKVYKELGVVALTSSDYEKYGSYNIFNIYDRFGTWFDFLDKAGIDSTKEALSNEKIIENIKYLSNKHKQAISQKIYSEDKEALASITTINKRFGSLQKLQEIAGVEVYSPNNAQDLSDEEILESIRKVEEEVGNVTIPLYDKSEYRVCSARSIIRRFGTWSKAKSLSKRGL